MKGVAPERGIMDWLARKWTQNIEDISGMIVYEAWDLLIVENLFGGIVEKAFFCIGPIA